MEHDPATAGAAVIEFVGTRCCNPPAPPQNVRIEGNFIGVAPDGATVSGGATGIVLTGSGHVIGGRAPARRNIIAGHRVGITGYGFGENLVVGNYIGLDPSGMRDGYGNGTGIDGYIAVIGGTAPGTANVISNNGIGLGLGSGLVVGNLIGPLANGAPAEGNQVGVTHAWTIGGLPPGYGNVIAFNRIGVQLLASRSRILSNLIYGNAEMDIELGEDGPTPNDLGDSDAGPNELQNFPVISRVTRDAGVTTVAGGLNSVPASMFTLQFFATGATRTAAPTLLGTQVVDTNTAGDARFEFTFPFVTSGEQFIRATATDAKGNTSEFLPADAEAELVNISTRGSIGVDDEILIGGIIRREASSPRPLLVRALGPSLNFGDPLADPRLTVYGPDGTIVAENDDWKSSPEQEQKI